MRLKVLLLMTVLFGLSHVSAAATITAFNRAAFQAAVGSGVDEQNFDTFAAGTELTTDGNVNYAASGGTPLVTSEYLTTSIPNGLGSTSAGFFLPDETATFTFLMPVTAFGIDINTFSPTEGAYRAVVGTGDQVLSKFDVFPGEATGQFIGFTSDTAFTSVTIEALTGFTYTLDGLVYGEAGALLVPEPTVLGLVGLGIVAALRRRTRTAR